MSSSLTKKDFEELAGILHRARLFLEVEEAHTHHDGIFLAYDVVDNIELELMGFCQSRNPNFQPRVFKKYANLEEPS